MATSDRIIQPGDPDWQSEDVATLISGAAFGPEMFAIATSLAGEYHYEFDNYCRFPRYVEGHWIMTEIGRLDLPRLEPFATRIRSLGRLFGHSGV